MIQAWPECQSHSSFDDSSKILGFIAGVNIEAGIRLEEISCLRGKREEVAVINHCNSVKD